MIPEYHEFYENEAAFNENDLLNISNNVLDIILSERHERNAYYVSLSTTLLDAVLRVRFETESLRVDYFVASEEKINKILDMKNSKVLSDTFLLQFLLSENVISPDKLFKAVYKQGIERGKTEKAAQIRQVLDI